MCHIQRSTFIWINGDTSKYTALIVPQKLEKNKTLVQDYTFLPEIIIHCNKPSYILLHLLTGTLPETMSTLSVLCFPYLPSHHLPNRHLFTTFTFIF
jgi:hypothetical protein